MLIIVWLYENSYCKLLLCYKEILIETNTKNSSNMIYKENNLLKTEKSKFQYNLHTTENKK